MREREKDGFPLDGPDFDITVCLPASLVLQSLATCWKVLEDDGDDDDDGLQ